MFTTSLLYFRNIYTFIIQCAIGKRRYISGPRVHVDKHSADQRARTGPRAPSLRHRALAGSRTNQGRSLGTSAGAVAAHVAAGFSWRGRGRARPRGVFCVAA